MSRASSGIRGTSIASALLAGFVFTGAGVSQDIDQAQFKNWHWREIGPYRGGRSAAVTGLANDRDTYYFGAAGGGVWKTTDAGGTWENVSDGFFGGSIGAVTVSEWDPNVVYAGGGEKTVRGNVSHGDGVWKSVDAGKTWKHVGLEDSRRIPRLRIHPKNPDLVYAAVLGHLFGPNEQRGIYRSTDGGESWERILFVNSEVGAVDLVLDLTNPRILYASFWRVQRTPYRLESGGEGSGLYRSVDGGDTWDPLHHNEGFPTAPLGIIGITVSPTNPDNLYAMIESDRGGVYRSRDAGETWTRTNEDRELRQRAWYYSRIYADPADEESLYVLNVQFHRSRDGGKSFTKIGTPHSDNHDLWIDPADPRRMIEGNDGGANISFDGGKTWTRQDNQPTAQMYRVSTDNDFPYRLLGGQQDNSAIRLRSRSLQSPAIGVRDWEPTAGGESGHVVAKPDDPDVVFGGSYGGYLTMKNHRTGERRAVNVWPDNPMGWGAADLKYRFQWNFPLFFSPHDADVLYAAANVLFRSDDLGASWQAISPDLTRNDKSTQGSSGGPITQDNTSVEYYGTIFAALESPHEPGVLWTGSDDGRLHLSRDHGKSWTDVTPPDLPEWSQINGMSAHPTNPDGVYFAATRYKLDDFQPLLYRTSDCGKTWTKITSGIAKEHFTRALVADPERAGLLYAGTERGVYVSFNDGNRWQPWQLDLPIVPITDLAVKNGDLVAATQGRGYWILDDLGPLRQWSESLAKQPRLFQPRVTARVPGGHTDEPGHRGENPREGVFLSYWLPEAVDATQPLQLRVLQANGTEILTFTRKPETQDSDNEKGQDSHSEDDDAHAVLSPEEGFHRLSWDLRYPPPDDFDGMVVWNRVRRGVLAPPGNYQGELVVGDQRVSVEFEVTLDPRTSVSREEAHAQFHFAREVHAKLSETHRAIGEIRKVRPALQAMAERFDEGTPLRAEIDAALETLTGIEETLYQTKNQSPQDPLNFPIRLNDKLAGLLTLVSHGDHEPTRQAQEVRQLLVEAIDGQLQQLRHLREETLPALNASIHAAEKPAIEWPKSEPAATGNRPAKN